MNTKWNQPIAFVAFLSVCHVEFEAKTQCIYNGASGRETNAELDRFILEKFETRGYEVQDHPWLEDAVSGELENRVVANGVHARRYVDLTDIGEVLYRPALERVKA